MFRFVCIATAFGLAWAAPAAAEPGAPAPLAPRILNVPTGHVQPSLHVHASGGAFLVPDATPSLAATLGLGGVADIDVELHDRVAICTACDGDEATTASIASPSAAFKMGLGEGLYASWQPAVALGLRAPAGGREVDIDGEVHELSVARLFLAATRSAGPVEVTLGVDAWDAESRAGDRVWRMSDEPVGDRVRPFAGVVFSPPSYPRTYLAADWSWAPVFDAGRGDLRWLFGWGVRYQALTWGSIELDVRHREGGALGDAEVSVRLNGAWDLRDLVR